MDRKRFLTTLKHTLWWRLPPEELSSVLEDYNEYFDSGIAQGRSETELSEQFGKPSEIATDIVVERGSKYYAVAFASISLCAGLLLIAIVPLVHPGWLFDTTYNELLLYIGIFVLSTLSVLLTKRMAEYASSPRVSRCITVLNIIVLSLVAFITVAAAKMFDWIGIIDDYIPVEKIGPIVALMIVALILIIVLLWLATIFWCASLRRWQLVLVPVNAMLLSLMVNLIVILGGLSEPVSFMLALFSGVRLSLLQLLPIVLIFVPYKGRAR